MGYQTDASRGSAGLQGTNSSGQRGRGGQMAEFFLHIGMRKTASTFLQKEVFPRLAGVHFVAPATPVTQLFRYPSDGKVLISDEGLSGHPWRVPLDPTHDWVEDRRSRLRSASQLFPGARVIVCFRQHRAFVASLYKQYLHRGGVMRLEEFFRLDGTGMITPDDLSYRAVLEVLSEHFGTDPFVFSYHAFGRIDLLLDRLCSFVGVPVPTDVNANRRVNPGVRSAQGAILRQLNRVSVGPLNEGGILPLRNRWLARLGLDPRTLCQRRLAFLPGDDIDFEPGLAARIDEHFAEDWHYVKDHAAL